MWCKQVLKSKQIFSDLIQVTVTSRKKNQIKLHENNP